MIPRESIFWKGILQVKLEPLVNAHIVGVLKHNVGFHTFQGNTQEFNEKGQSNISNASSVLTRGVSAPNINIHVYTCVYLFLLSQISSVSMIRRSCGVSSVVVNVDNKTLKGVINGAGADHMTISASGVSP